MSSPIDLRERRTKKAYLDYLYYEVAKQDPDLYLAYTRKDKYGEQRWSKWRRYIDAQTDDWFINRACHRTILKNEIVIDLDHPTIQENLAEAKNTIQLLKSYGYGYWAFKTGSKGVHIHVFFKNLDKETPPIRKRFKQIFLERVGADNQKSVEKTMIAIEHQPHWKTGNKKEFYDFDGIENHFLGGR